MVFETAAPFDTRRLGKERSDESDDAALPELSVRILRALRTRERMSIAQLVESTGANRNTLKKGLGELVESGRIRRYGKARATWYSLP